MPGRKYTPGSGYRYGFNGKENDNDVKGEGNQQDYGMRIYDPRLGRFLSEDPITKKYPELTPYQFSSNSPISMIDLDGLEGIKYDKWDKNSSKILGGKYGHIDPIFTSGRLNNESDAAWLGISTNQTVIFKSNFQNQRINNIIKTGDPKLPPLIIYKYDIGNSTPAYQTYTPVYKTVSVPFITNTNDYVGNQTESFKSIANSLSENKTLKVDISGATDRSSTEPTGTAKIDGVKGTNFTFSDLVNARATAIVNTLVKDYGVDPTRINITPPSFNQSDNSTNINIYDQKDKPKNLKDVEKDIPSTSTNAPAPPKIK